MRGECNMKQNYDNPLRRQCFDLVRLAPAQFDLAREALLRLEPEKRLAGIRRVVVTGCGDSYLAAAQAREVFKHYLKGTGCRMEAVRAIEAARYLPLEEDAAGTLLIAISASGGPARIAEILQRGKQHGCLTMALTNNGASRAGTTADLAYVTNTPEFPDRMPGLRSYLASMMGLFVLAAVLGEVKSGKTGLCDGLRAALEAYNGRFADALEQMDDSAYAAAVAMKDSKGFEVCADGPLFCCGEFISAKYAEVSGDKCTVVDSENFWHVNSIMMPQNAYGTIDYVVSDEGNCARMAETISGQVEKLGRKVLVVADKPAAELGVTAPVMECILPVPDRQFRFLLPLYAFVPGSLVAGYHAALIEEPYFRGGGKFFGPSINTLGTNGIRVL